MTHYDDDAFQNRTTCDPFSLESVAENSGLHPKPSAFTLHKHALSLLQESARAVLLFLTTYNCCLYRDIFTHESILFCLFIQGLSKNRS